MVARPPQGFHLTAEILYKNLENGFKIGFLNETFSSFLFNLSHFYNRKINKLNIPM